MSKSYDIALTRSMELDAIKDIDIVQYLQEMGFKPRKETYKIVWYISPFRSEREASFAVYKRKKPMDWYDYGEGIGGSIIDLVMKLHDLAYVDALKHLRKYLGFTWGNV